MYNIGKDMSYFLFADNTNTNSYKINA